MGGVEMFDPTSHHHLFTLRDTEVRLHVQILNVYDHASSWTCAVSRIIHIVSTEYFLCTNTLTPKLLCTSMLVNIHDTLSVYSISAIFRVLKHSLSEIPY